MNINKSFVIALALILALIKLSNGYAITDRNQQNIILGEHNRLRGLARSGQLCNNCGTATNMQNLQWDSAQANEAEQYARQCNSHCDSNKYQCYHNRAGQNLAWGTGYRSAEEAIKDRQNSWTQELSQGLTGYNHISQMVDDDSLRVGCAINPSCPGIGWLLVCNYDPMGNNANTPVYATGSTGGSSGGSTGGSSGGSSGGSVPTTNQLCGSAGGYRNGNGFDGRCHYTYYCNNGRIGHYTADGLCPTN